MNARRRCLKTALAGSLAAGLPNDCLGIGRRKNNGNSQLESLLNACEQGLRQRYGTEPEKKLTNSIQDRLTHELRIIDRLELTTSFLKIGELATWSKEESIPLVAQGPINGSLVVFALGLCPLCPVDYGLFFERFIDPNGNRGNTVEIDLATDLKHLNEGRQFTQQQPDTRFRFDVLGLPKMSNGAGPIQIERVADANICQAGLRDLVRRVRPKCLREFLVCLALYRPGPLEAGLIDEYLRRKHKADDFTNNAVLIGNLKETLGLALYQEHLMQILSRSAGFKVRRAYETLRNIVKGKRHRAEEAQLQFVKSMSARGMHQNEIQTVWEFIVTACHFSVCKARLIGESLTMIRCQGS